MSCPGHLNGIAGTVVDAGPISERTLAAGDGPGYLLSTDLGLYGDYSHTSFRPTTYSPYG